MPAQPIQRRRPKARRPRAFARLQSTFQGQGDRPAQVTAAVLGNTDRGILIDFHERGPGDTWAPTSFSLRRRAGGTAFRTVVTRVARRNVDEMRNYAIADEDNYPVPRVCQSRIQLGTGSLRQEVLVLSEPEFGAEPQNGLAEGIGGGGLRGIATGCIGKSLRMAIRL